MTGRGAPGDASVTSVFSYIGKGVGVLREARGVSGVAVLYLLLILGAVSCSGDESATGESASGSSTSG